MMPSVIPAPQKKRPKSFGKGARARDATNQGKNTDNAANTDMTACCAMPPTKERILATQRMTATQPMLATQLVAAMQPMLASQPMPETPFTWWHSLKQIVFHRYILLVCFALDIILFNRLCGAGDLTFRVI